MDAIRPETEIDRTQAALAARGLTLPLPRGQVEIAISQEAAGSPVGQRLLVLLVNALARMKGIVARVHVVGVGREPVLPGVPLLAADLGGGLLAMIANLNTDASDISAELRLEAAPDPVARIRVGDAVGQGLLVGADGWRALLGRYAAEANWQAPTPYGAALAAALATAEVFKQLLAGNGAADPAQHLVEDLAYSTYNYGLDGEAAEGPALTGLVLDDMAVAGCGAGGSAALYVLGMQPGLSGSIALIEPGRHKPSNLNRYLMTTASDVHERRHKLASAINHLAIFAPGLRPTLHACPWEQADAHPWGLVLSAVDTVEARWAIQDRCRPDAAILDGAVMGLLYAILRVVPGGWCLECKHPYDPNLALKQRAARWGQSIETIRTWTSADQLVTTSMLAALARTQNRPVERYAALHGVPFNDTPRLTECGETALRTDVPSQAPMLPVATTPIGALLAAEVAKHHAAADAHPSNWLAHDLLRAPARPRVTFRPAVATCPRH